MKLFNFFRIIFSAFKTLLLNINIHNYKIYVRMYVFIQIHTYLLIPNYHSLYLLLLYCFRICGGKKEDFDFILQKCKKWMIQRIDMYPCNEYMLKLDMVDKNDD
jgi:hypothetical protein